MLVRGFMNKTTGGAPTAMPADESLKDRIVHGGHEAVDAVKVRVVEITDKAKSKGEDLYAQAKSKGSDIYAQVAEVIAAQPFKAIAVAFGVGYLAMRINTSKLTPLAVIGGLGYLGAQLLRQPKPDASR